MPQSMRARNLDEGMIVRAFVSRVLHRLVAAAQRAVVRTGYAWPGSFENHRAITWVVGPNEVARMVSQVAAVVPGAYSALIVRHPFYDDPYDYLPPAGESARQRAWRLRVRNAWLFGRLVRHALGFIYLSQNGYLSDQHDDRRFEFSFLKRHGAKVVCFFTGSDIRSPELMKLHEQQTGLPNVASYLRFSDPLLGTSDYDESRRRIGQTADAYADLIFTARVDQAGYLNHGTEPFIYFFPDEKVADSLQKFENLQRPVLLHAPSSPVIKGTQLVRAAVAALQHEGLEFEYVELSGVPHERVAAELERSHVVLNEFYAHTPGVFGVEALAAGTVVLTSADETVEPDLPAGSNKAWVVTKHWQVYHHLKEVLEHPERMLAQAEAGQYWVEQHALASKSGERLRALLDHLLEASK